MNNGLNIIGQSDVVVQLECRYPSTISLSSTYGIAVITTFNAEVRFTATYIDEALLDPTTQIFKDTVKTIVNQILENWIGEPRPTSITINGFTISNGGTRRRRTVSNEGILMGQLEVTFESETAESAEEMLRNTLRTMQQNGKLFHANFNMDNLAFETTVVNVNNWHKAAVQGDGNFAGGFDFDIFDDNTHETELTQMNLGSFLFAKIEWSIAVSGMSFYVKTCKYSCGTNPLASADIIKVSPY